jgi:hypothetical protein
MPKRTRIQVLKLVASTKEKHKEFLKGKGNFLYKKVESNRFAFAD